MGSTSAMVRKMAEAVNRSLDGNLSRCTPFDSAPRMMVMAVTIGELPAMMWTRRGGKARIRLEKPRMSRVFQPSITSVLPRLSTTSGSNCSRLNMYCMSL
ncbi:hypothetical protein D9M71_626630 [compost metagenome]